MAGSLEHSQVVHYLLSLGLVKPRTVTHEALVVTDVSARNSVFLAQIAGGPAYVVKQAGPAGPGAIAREARVLRALAGAGGLVPELVHHDAEAGRIVLRSPPDAREWGSETTRSPLAARALGRALATVHAARVDVPALAPEESRLWGLSLPEPPLARLDGFSAGALDLLARLQADERLCARLTGVRAELRADAFTHGDIRRENCLMVAAPGARRRTRVLLIDWEHAAPGVPEYDLASALAEYLRAWVLAFPAVTPVSDMRRLEVGSPLPLETLHAAIGALWTAYRGAAERPVDWLPVTQLTGVRLLEIAFEYARGTPFVAGHALNLLQVASGMLESPGYAFWHLLGLRTA